MSRRYWRKDYPYWGVGGFVAALLFAGLIALPIGVEDNPGEAPRATYGHSDAKYGLAPAQRLRSGGYLIDGPIEPLTGEPITNPYKCETKAERQTIACRDLRAQESMSVWALCAAVLTAFGVVLLYRTLVYTADAARFAAKTLDEAEKATIAANKTVDATWKVGKAQTRAYLSAERADFRIKDHFLVCEAFFRNSGQSPAKNIRIDYRYMRDGHPMVTVADDWEDETPPIPSRDVGAAHFHVVEALPDFALDDVRNHPSEFYFLGEISWTDVFDDPQRMGFSFVPDKVVKGRSYGSLKANNFQINRGPDD